MITSFGTVTRGNWYQLGRYVEIGRGLADPRQDEKEGFRGKIGTDIWIHAGIALTAPCRMEISSKTVIMKRLVKSLKNCPKSYT